MGVLSSLFGKNKKNKEQAAAVNEVKEPVGTAATNKKEDKAASAEKKPAAKETKVQASAPAAKETVKPAAKSTASTSKPKTASAKTAAANETKKSVEKKAEVAPKKAAEKASEEKKVEEAAPAKSSGSGRFEIKKSKDGRYVFNLYASNHVIIATSQVYSSSQSAINGIKSVIANAGKAPVEDQTLKNPTELPYPKWEIYQDKGGQYRFRLCAPNGSCVCHSQGYTSKSNCKNGIESIIKFANEEAEIDKSYLKKD